MSLTEVEALTNQEFKASVLGAYERGERAMSVQRLVRLASVYGIAVNQLIPSSEEMDVDAGPTTIDLDRITDAEASAVVDRFLSSIHLMRSSDPSGMTVRRSDMAILSSMLEALPNTSVR